MKKLYLLIALGALICTSCGKEDSPVNNGGGEAVPTNWAAAADSSSMSLVNNFWNSGNKYFNYDSSGKTDFHYWPQAHALDVLVDAYARSREVIYKNYFGQWFEGVKIKNGNTFDNDYFDDMEWNALAILRAYQATGETQYKDAALQIWEYIKKGWNDNAGGGIMWVKNNVYGKNACSNGPACILAARLYQEFGDENNKEWALKIYNWEKSTLFNSSTGAVYDNIDGNTGNINKSWVFTYNQGTFIGSAVELHKITSEKAYLNDAALAADYTISTLVDNSVLKSEGTGDGGLFKGIFIRYFTDLIQQARLDAPYKKKYVQFMKYNANILWTTGTTKPAVFFGPNWRTKPGASTGLTEQLSGCMMIEAMALLDKKELL